MNRYVMGFSERLKSAMNAKGINAAQLASNTGISKGSISKYLKRGELPKLDNIKKLASFLNVPTDYLLEKTSNTFPNSKKLADDVSPSKKKIISEIVDMCKVQDNENLELILSFLIALAKKK